jgi:hypothetical protein
MNDKKQVRDAIVQLAKDKKIDGVVLNRANNALSNPENVEIELVIMEVEEVFIESKILVILRI